VSNIDDIHVEILTDFLGMEYTLTMSETDQRLINEICDISRWEDEGGAIPQN